jgi:hypothetical protein
MALGLCLVTNSKMHVEWVVSHHFYAFFTMYNFQSTLKIMLYITWTNVNEYKQV